jgi:hypothetical protein
VGNAEKFATYQARGALPYAVARAALQVTDSDFNPHPTDKDLLHFLLVEQLPANEESEDFEMLDLLFGEAVLPLDLLFLDHGTLPAGFCRNRRCCFIVHVFR